MKEKKKRTSHFYRWPVDSLCFQPFTVIPSRSMIKKISISYFNQSFLSSACRFVQCLHWWCQPVTFIHQPVDTKIAYIYNFNQSLLYTACRLIDFILFEFQPFTFMPVNLKIFKFFNSTSHFFLQPVDL